MAVRSEATWRRCWKPNLNSQPWKPFTIAERLYIVKAHFVVTECSYEMCVSDLQNIWYERVDRETFRSRAKELNPNLEAKMSYLMKHLQRNVENQEEETTYSIIQEDTAEDSSNLVLHLKTKLQAGVPFVWDFHCTTADQQFVSLHQAQPMMCMVAELHRRQTELHNLLKRKDAEIKNYKESGVKLSRKNLETQEFDEENFNSRMVLSSGFADAVEYAGKLAFTKSTQELYRQVMIKRAWLQDKDQPEPELPEGESLFDIPDTATLVEGGLGPSLSSWGDRLPPSLLAKDVSPNVSPRGSPGKTPITSPAKSAQLSSPETSPSKERELQRREDLRRKLAEEAEKKKRKKKKIKL